jgi:hypothetical protein
MRGSQLLCHHDLFLFHSALAKNLPISLEKILSLSPLFIFIFLFYFYFYISDRPLVHWCVYFLFHPHIDWPMLYTLKVFFHPRSSLTHSPPTPPPLPTSHPIHFIHPNTFGSAPPLTYWSPLVYILLRPIPLLWIQPLPYIHPPTYTYTYTYTLRLYGFSSTRKYMVQPNGFGWICYFFFSFSSFPRVSSLHLIS